MLKLLLLLLGLAGGAAGAAAWLLGEPGPGSEPTGSDSLNERVRLLRTRLDDALATGQRAGAEAENRVRHEFETWRLHPDRPNTSA